MKVRNAGRIMIAKGIELDRDVYPGETSQVKAGFEQSERIKAAIHSGSLEPMDVVNIKSQGGTIAVQPGSFDPFADFGKDIPLPRRVLAHQKASEATEKPTAWVVPLDDIGEKELPLPGPAAKQMREDKSIEEPIDRVVEKNIIEEKDVLTSQLLKTEEPITEEPKIDEFAEFFRRKGQSRLHFIREMTDLKALRQVLISARGAKSKEALMARIAELSHITREGEVGI